MLPFKPKEINTMSTKLDSKTETKAQGETPATTYKTPILNPAWAEEVVKARGINGPLAKAIAADLAKDVTKYVSKSLNDERITKIIRASFGVHVGKVSKINLE